MFFQLKIIFLSFLIAIFILQLVGCFGEELELVFKKITDYFFLYRKFGVKVG